MKIFSILREADKKDERGHLTHELAQIRAEIAAARGKGDKQTVAKLMPKVNQLVDRIQGLRENTAHTEATLSALNKAETKKILDQHRSLLVKAILDGDTEEEAQIRDVIADCEKELSESVITEAGEADMLKKRIAKMKADIAELPDKTSDPVAQKHYEDMREKLKQMQGELAELKESTIRNTNPHGQRQGELYANTADGVYSMRFNNIEQMLKGINAKLDAHNERQQKDTKNWGYAGDLESVEAKLQEVLEFLGAA